VTPPIAPPKQKCSVCGGPVPRQLGDRKTCSPECRRQARGPWRTFRPPVVTEPALYVERRR
jgi:predicted nucleic acid-binding Zn ribbon protein